MKITVNQNQAKLRKEQVIGEIMASAKDAAFRGVNNFIYQFKVDERRSFLSNINRDIEEASEGTVKCAYRGDHEDWVKYIIG